MSVGLRPCPLQEWATCDGNCGNCEKTAITTTDGYWYHGSGKLGGEFYPNKPDDKERYGEYVKIVRCKDCKHKPTGSGVNHDITFPDQDYRCPCRCEDFWYSWMPDDDWFCGNGERKEEVENG